MESPRRDDRGRIATGGAVAGLALGAAILAFVMGGGPAAPDARADDKKTDSGDDRGKEKKSLPEVMKRMKYYNKALGVECDYCHVPNKFEIETPRRKTAKWMQERLVDDLVKREGSQPIDCLTCHDGRARFLPSSQ